MHSTKRSARIGERGLVPAIVLLASGLGIDGGQLDLGDKRPHRLRRHVSPDVGAGRAGTGV